MGKAEGFPEFIPSTSWLSRTKAPFIDESPALTVVLQAHVVEPVILAAGGRAAQISTEAVDNFCITEA